MTNLPKFSTALLHPRYWLTWLGIGVLWLVVHRSTRLSTASVVD